MAQISGGLNMRSTRTTIYLAQLAFAVLSTERIHKLVPSLARRRLRLNSAQVCGNSQIYIESATLGDIASIQVCNRASLPENYADSFYERHLRQWPDLSFVARADAAVVGYVLGRLEDGEQAGHITSLAVLDAYRRRGLARSLMSHVHHHLVRKDILVAKLHVRCSNNQALQLYTSLGYTIQSVVKAYYADGEAAYLMAAHLHPNSNTSPTVIHTNVLV